MMNIHHIADTTVSSLKGTRADVNQHERAFAGVLAGTTDDLDARRALLREAAEQLVSSAFISPVLGAMRDNTMAEGPFAPGDVERRFGPLLDQHFADRIVAGSRFSLIDTIVDRYLPQPSDSEDMPERTYA